MIKNTCLMLLASSIPMRAMELSAYKPTIKDLQHKCEVLKEELQSKPYSPYVFDPNVDSFYKIYEAKNDTDVQKVILVCKPCMRIREKYSTLGIIAITPAISLEYKKKFIKDLYGRGFNATPEDKELAIIEARERCEKEKIIYKISLLFLAYHKDPFTSFKSLPTDMIQYVALLGFEAELLL